MRYITNKFMTYFPYVVYSNTFSFLKMWVTLIHNLLMSCDPQFEKHYPRNSSDGQMGNRKRKRGEGGSE